QLNDQAWRKPVDEFAEPPVRLTDRAASRRLVASVQEVLVHSIYNRNGDVDLTAVRGLLNRHESPHVVLASALAFIGSVDAFRSRVRSVTNAEYRGGRWQSVVDDAFLARLFDRSGPVQTWRGFRIESARLKDLTEFLPDSFTGGAWRAALPQPEADSLGLPEVLLRWRAENDMWPDGRPRETGNLPIGSVEPPSAGGAQQSGAHAQGDTTTAVPGHDAESTTPGQDDAEPTTPGQDDAEPTTPGQDAAGMTTPEQGDVVADTSARGEVEVDAPVWGEAEQTVPAADDVDAAVPQAAESVGEQPGPAPVSDRTEQVRRLLPLNLVRVDEIDASGMRSEVEQAMEAAGTPQPIREQILAGISDAVLRTSFTPATGPERLTVAAGRGQEAVELSVRLWLEDDSIPRLGMVGDRKGKARADDADNKVENSSGKFGKDSDKYAGVKASDIGIGVRRQLLSTENAGAYARVAFKGLRPPRTSWEISSTGKESAAT